MTRVFNFSAGPSQLPTEVLQKCAAELMEYGISGQSVMEMSHRSSSFLEIIETTERRLRSLLQIPESYQVLFLQGGASLQFTMAPMNLLKLGGKAGVIHTGAWTKKAIAECRKIGGCEILASSEAEHFTSIPKGVTISQDLDYVHICENNTIYGTKYKELPECGNVPLIADCSSCILSEPMEISRYGLIFAGAQKNMGDRRSDGCDRAGRSDSGTSGDSVDAELCRAGEKQVDVQYAADLCDLSAGAGVGMDRKPLS